VPASPPADSAPEPLDARILLAEDNPAIQRVTALHLERLGATVVLARNGQEAIDLALGARDDGRPFDAVLMDMQMPVLDGYEATRQLRAVGFPGTIIALTAYAMVEDREECLRLGCDDHLSKPIDWGLLASIIARRLAPKANARPEPHASRAGVISDSR
jgi:CheY-like chemotaxis protein